jgi:hypothetical protein
VKNPLKPITDIAKAKYDSLPAEQQKYARIGGG